MEEDELAAAERKRREIRGRRLDQRIGGMQRRLVDVEFSSSGVGAEEAVGAQRQQSLQRIP